LGDKPGGELTEVIGMGKHRGRSEKVGGWVASGVRGVKKKRGGAFFEKKDRTEQGN